jgi:hypothetical protein
MQKFAFDIAQAGHRCHQPYTKAVGARRVAAVRAAE